MRARAAIAVLALAAPLALAALLGGPEEPSPSSLPVASAPPALAPGTLAAQEAATPDFEVRLRERGPLRSPTAFRALEAPAETSPPPLPARTEEAERTVIAAAATPDPDPRLRYAPTRRGPAWDRPPDGLFPEIRNAHLNTAPAMGAGGTLPETPRSGRLTLAPPPSEAAEETPAEPAAPTPTPAAEPAPRLLPEPARVALAATPPMPPTPVTPPALTRPAPTPPSPPSWSAAPVRETPVPAAPRGPKPSPVAADAPAAIPTLPKASKATPPDPTALAVGPPAAAHALLSPAKGAPPVATPRVAMGPPLVVPPTPAPPLAAPSVSAPPVKVAGPPVAPAVSPVHKSPLVIAGLSEVEELQASFGGQHVVPADLVVAQGGVLGGSGRVQGSLHNTGTVSPGHSPGVVELAGDFDQSDGALLVLELGGTELEAYDRLLVDGDATLRGVIEVQLWHGFVPQVGDVFDVIEADAIHDLGAVWVLPDLPVGVLVASVLSEVDGDVVRLTTAAANAIAQVPEPAAPLLLGLALFAFRRRPR